MNRLELIGCFQVFDAADWDAMLLQHIVPKLGATLRDDFRVNPRNQDMAPIQNVLLWSGIVRPSIFSQLLETSFFTKWLDVLHFWLTRPEVNLKEVAEWYEFWRDKAFPDVVRNMPRVSHGFMRGVQLMHRASELGPAARTHLPRPDHNADTSPPAVTPTPSQPSSTHKGRSARTYEITFRSIVEEFAASHNLLLVPTGRAHEKSRMPLFRVSRTVDGKGGLLIYILDDAVWLATDGEGYRAISLEDMVAQASLL
jgi:tuftelin-interacting protein 11